MRNRWGSPRSEFRIDSWKGVKMRYVRVKQEADVAARYKGRAGKVREAFDNGNISVEITNATVSHGGARLVLLDETEVETIEEAEFKKMEKAVHDDYVSASIRRTTYDKLKERQKASGLALSDFIESILNQSV